MAEQSSIKLCFFSDDKADHFHPLTLTRPLDDLRVGIYTIREKWMRALKTTSACRLQSEYLKDVFDRGSIEVNENVIWINARFLPSEKLLKAIDLLEEGQGISFRGDIAAAKINDKSSREIFDQNEFSAKGLNMVPVEELIHLEQLWDLLSLNQYEIEKDIPLTNLNPVLEGDKKFKGTVYDPDNTFIADDVEIEPGVIIVAKKGPVVIMEGAHIEAGSILKGPVVVGEGATVKMGARIYDGTTIGPVCKVGGEVSNCIFHSYSNKGHDGFTGNSIFGQWVNLGADTNTSNLKNNYSTVRIPDWNTKEVVETELQFLGTIMGDHTKTAINAMLNTGTICGVSSNIFMPGFPPKYIPSFSWVASEEYSEYNFDKAIEAMRAMMKRRDVNLSEGYKNMMEFIYKNS